MFLEMNNQFYFTTSLNTSDIGYDENCWRLDFNINDPPALIYADSILIPKNVPTLIYITDDEIIDVINQIALTEYETLEVGPVIIGPENIEAVGVLVRFNFEVLFREDVTTQINLENLNFEFDVSGLKLSYRMLDQLSSRKNRAWMPVSDAEAIKFVSGSIQRLKD